jgi:hypothetical protein
MRREEEEAKKVPYEEEMALCDHLVMYLKTTFLSEEGQAGDGGQEEKKSGGSAGGLEHGGVILTAYR